MKILEVNYRDCTNIANSNTSNYKCNLIEMTHYNKLFGQLRVIRHNMMSDT